MQSRLSSFWPPNVKILLSTYLLCFLTILSSCSSSYPRLEAFIHLVIFVGASAGACWVISIKTMWLDAIVRWNASGGEIFIRISNESSKLVSPLIAHREPFLATVPLTTINIWISADAPTIVVFNFSFKVRRALAKRGLRSRRMGRHEPHVRSSSWLRRCRSVLVDTLAFGVVGHFERLNASWIELGGRCKIMLKVVRSSNASHISDTLIA